MINIMAKMKDNATCLKNVIQIIEISTGKVILEIDVSGKWPMQVEMCKLGISLQMNMDEYYIEEMKK